MKIAAIFFFLSVFSLWGYKLPKGIDPSGQNEIEAALNELAEPDESVGFGQGGDRSGIPLGFPSTIFTGWLGDGSLAIVIQILR